MGYEERQAVWLTESIDNGILVLELFKQRAREAIPLLQQKVKELAEEGPARHEVFRIRFFESLISHLREAHGIVD